MPSDSVCRFYLYEPIPSSLTLLVLAQRQLPPCPILEGSNVCPRIHIFIWSTRSWNTEDHLAILSGQRIYHSRGSKRCKVRLVAVSRPNIAHTDHTRCTLAQLNITHSQRKADIKSSARTKANAKVLVQSHKPGSGTSQPYDALLLSWLKPLPLSWRRARH
jgi:hypothetical protein